MPIPQDLLLLLTTSETIEFNVFNNPKDSADMPFDTQAIVIPAPGQDFQLLDVTLDDPLDDEVVVDMVACGSVHRSPPHIELATFQSVTSRPIQRSAEPGDLVCDS